jgi:uncharacterized membrane protein YcjF (UPF0283 family)
MLVDDAEHFGAGEMFEARPAQVLVELAAVILAVREDAALNRLAEREALRSSSSCISSRRLMKMRYVICSITCSGLASPPDQKSFQMPSI